MSAPPRPGVVVDLAEWRERRALGFVLPEARREALLEAAEVASLLLPLLAEARDAAAVLRVAEAITSAGHGNAARALVLLEDLTEDFRGSSV